MPPRDWFLRFVDILKAIEKIENYIGIDSNYVDFETDSRTVDAVIRQLTIIGEASNHVPEEIQEHFPKIPWLDVIALRNFVIHEYFGITLKTVWDTAKNDLPPLKREVSTVVNQGQESFRSLVITKKKRSVRTRKMTKKK